MLRYPPVAEKSEFLVVLHKSTEKGQAPAKRELPVFERRSILPDRVARRLSRVAVRPPRALQVERLDAQKREVPISRPLAMAPMCGTDAVLRRRADGISERA